MVTLIGVYYLRIQNVFGVNELKSLISYISDYKKKGDCSDVSIVSVLSDLYVRYLISKEVGISIEQVIIQIDKSGKPYCLNYPKIHFSISHSSNYIVIAFDDDEIGVDIEEIKSIDLGVKRMCFSGNELILINELQSRESQLAFFYQIWTLKESYSKYIKKGLSLDFKKLDTLITSDFIKMKFNDVLLECNFYVFDSIDNYAIAICSKNDDYSNSFHYHKGETFLAKIYSYFSYRTQILGVETE